MSEALPCTKQEGSPAPVHPSRQDLHAFALGRLLDDELEAVGRPLASCSSCRQIVDRAPADALIELAQRAAAGQSPRLRLQAGYEILDEIGRGGMGVVYRARQLDIQRIVAFKQIDGLVGAEKLARFRAEASAMARLHHPNIVQVFDVGEQDERPYIACEFVAGGGLDKRLSGGPLPIRDACRLVAVLARAVHEAHQQSVVHRDLKPSNVLLSLPGDLEDEADEEGFWQRVIPKIADFGLAKFLNTQADHGCTRSGALLGTPAYMAPEQIGGAAGQVGPHADVYALGVILYEAVSGRRPFQGSTIAETLELVRGSDPVSLRRLRHGVPRDLEVICLKCLEKEPRRRYATAAELADDLERLLAGEAILARPAGLAERGLKWIRRRPAWAALIAVCLLALAGSAAGAAWHIRRLQAEIARANQNEAEALRNFRQGYAVLDQVIRELSRTAAHSPARRELNSKIWNQSLDFYYGALKGADESNPEVRLAKGMLLTYAGSVHACLGRHNAALRDLELGRKRLESLQQTQPGNAEVDYHLAQCWFWIGQVRTEQGRVDEAERFFLLAIDLDSQLIAEGAAFDRLAHRLAPAREALALLLSHAGRGESAAKQYEAALAIRRQIAAADPLDGGHRRKFGETSNALALWQMQNARRDRAKECLREGVAVIEAGEGAWQSPAIKAVLADAYRLWAIQFDGNEIDQAVVYWDLAIAKLREIQAEDPMEPAIANLAPTLRNKALSLSRAGRTDWAFAVWGDAIDHAQGAERDLYRAERAREQALAGAYALAVTEAGEIALHSGLQALNWLSLAQVYSRALEAVDRDGDLNAADAERLKADYIAQGTACLRRIDVEWLSAAGRLAELEADAQLSALRSTPEFAAWRTTVGQESH